MSVGFFSMVPNKRLCCTLYRTRESSARGLRVLFVPAPDLAPARECLAGLVGPQEVIANPRGSAIS